LNQTSEKIFASQKSFSNILYKDEPSHYKMELTKRAGLACHGWNRRIQAD
jgi:hypothetical protein